ncbi:MAG: DUF4956 domain-containing protein [Pseudomonadota bacterium]
MRKSTPIKNPLFLISSYFVLLILLVQAYVWLFPQHVPLLPFGGIEMLSEAGAADAEVIATFINPDENKSYDALTLALAIVGALLIMAPISWVYFITTRTKQVNRSFAQTIVVLPVIVAGIAMIVQHSLALAFSLAGVVAAVRFRFALEEPAHALYIFAAIAVGLGAGIGALGIAFVISVGFVYVNLLLWKLDYGSDLTTPFFSFLTGRGRDDNEL